MVSPGASSVPAKREPAMMVLAPAANALAISPVYLMPPSPTIGIPVPLKPLEAFMIAVSWGTPTPATILVVQILPGPTPTFTPFTPASAKALAPSAVATFPPII